MHLSYLLEYADQHEPPNAKTAPPLLGYPWRATSLLASTTFPSAAVHRAAELNPPSGSTRIRRTNYFPGNSRGCLGLLALVRGRVGPSGTGRAVGGADAAVGGWAGRAVIGRAAAGGGPGAAGESGRARQSVHELTATQRDLDGRWATRCESGWASGQGTGTQPVLQARLHPVRSSEQSGQQPGRCRETGSPGRSRVVADRGRPPQAAAQDRPCGSVQKVCNQPWRSAVCWLG
jgi:hypothetical protein